MKILIRGLGSIGLKYLEILQLFPVTHVDILSKFNVQKSYKFTTKQISKPDGVYDGVIISSSTQNHYTDLITLSNFSKRVLIEKPLFPKFIFDPKIEELINTNKVFISYPLRQSSHYARIFNLKLENMSEGRGQVECLSWFADWRPNRDIRDGYWGDPVQGGIVRELIHEINYVRSLIGSPVKLSAKFFTDDNPFKLKTETRAEITFYYPNLTNINILLSAESKVKSRKFFFKCKSFNLLWNLLEGSLEISQLSKISNFNLVENQSDLLFSQCKNWLSDDKASLVNIEEALLDLKLTDAIYKSNKKEGELIEL